VNNIENDYKIFLKSIKEIEKELLDKISKDKRIFDNLVKIIDLPVLHEIIIKEYYWRFYKKTIESMNIREGINVCIVEDPSISKNMHVRYILIPYLLSEKSHLTIAVVKDEESGDFTIEGICAIDEFDKMDISDQIAIMKLWNSRQSLSQKLEFI
ncbi:22990_t:CDS:2, partial [Racocetra persica]